MVRKGLLFLIVVIMVVAVAGVFAEDKGSSPVSTSSKDTLSTPVQKSISAPKASPTPKPKETPEPKPQKLWVFKDFGSSHCIPCKKMMPVLKELAEEYKGVLKVEFLELRENMQEARKYGVIVIPTQFLVDPEGEVRWKHIGFIPMEQIEKVLAKHGIKKPKKPPKSESTQTETGLNSKQEKKEDKKGGKK